MCADDLSTLTRSELVHRVLEKDEGLLTQLAKTHELRLFRFIRKPLPVQDFTELTAKGSTSPMMLSWGTTP